MVKWLDLNAISFDGVYDLLLDASRKAFRDIQAAHPDETFYAFGFYQHYEFEHTRLRFMLPVCHSEEAHLRLQNLTEVERENQTLEWFHKRWQSDKWQYWGVGQEHFGTVWQWMHDNIDGYVRPRDQELLSAIINYGMLSVYLKVLSVLDSEKLFGEGATREHVALTLSFCGGEEHPFAEQCEYTRSLNSISTYERWRIEMEAGQHTEAFFNPLPDFDDDFEGEDGDFDLDTD